MVVLDPLESMNCYKSSPQSPHCTVKILLNGRCDEDDPSQERQEAGGGRVCQDDVDVVRAESQCGGSQSPHPRSEK